jgi:hypothetical protein
LRQVYELVDAIDDRSEALLVEVRCDELTRDARKLPKKDAKRLAALMTQFTEVKYKTSSHQVLKMKSKIF